MVAASTTPPPPAPPRPRALIVLPIVELVVRRIIHYVCLVRPRHQLVVRILQQSDCDLLRSPPIMSKPEPRRWRSCGRSWPGTIWRFTYISDSSVPCTLEPCAASCAPTLNALRAFTRSATPASIYLCLWNRGMRPSLPFPLIETCGRSAWCNPASVSAFIQHLWAWRWEWERKGGGSTK